MPQNKKPRFLSRNRGFLFWVHVSGGFLNHFMDDLKVLAALRI